MLASSSHMYSSGQLRRYLQYFRKRLAWECPTKALVNIIQGHAIGQAFKNQRDREASPPDSQHAAQQEWVGHDPAVILVRPRFESLHLS